MTPEQHKQRHIELHRMLDELLADWLRATLSIPVRHDGPIATERPIRDLLEWSFRQTLGPDHDKHGKST